MIMPCKECKRQETCDDSGHCDRYIRAKKQREREKGKIEIDKKSIRHFKRGD